MFVHQIRQRCVFVSLLMVASSVFAGPIVIDTTPGTSFQGPFGEPASPYFGQTITPPAGTYLLTGFTFFLQGFNDPGPVQFQGLVREWDAVNFRPVGSPLYTSATQSTSPGGGLETFQFGPLAVPVDPAKQYLLLLSSVSNGIQGTGTVPQRGDNPLAGGQFVISNDGTTWFTGTSVSGLYDLAFIASFQVVPEPGSGWLLATGCGLLGLAVLGRRAFQSRS